MCAEVYQVLKSVIHGRGLATAVGDEGGFAPDLATNEDALRLIMEAIEKARYRPGEDIAITIDPAASEFRVDGKYMFKAEGVGRNSEEMIELYDKWTQKYPIISMRTASRRTTGTAGRSLRKSSAAGCSSWGTTSS
jgi:enolase